MENDYQTPPNGGQQTGEGQQKYSYGKRPLWQWIILYIIIGGALYAATYFIFFNKKGGNSYTSQNYQNNTNNTTNQMQTTNTSYNIEDMKVEIEKEGSGDPAKSGDMVTVNYTGTLLDGTKFDSSLNPGRTPFQFTLGQNQVIRGWELGVLGMRVGEKRKLTIPPELGYGAAGAGGVIPPNTTLIFEVDLLKIN
jgi:FKBP-type peptidyl-prolyl cis-trans isomerase